MGAGDAAGAGDGALVRGGGSMEECDVGGTDGKTGSGRDDISSSIEVSIVTCLVDGPFWRRV